MGGRMPAIKTTSFKSDEEIERMIMECKKRFGIKSKSEMLRLMIKVFYESNCG